MNYSLFTCFLLMGIQVFCLFLSFFVFGGAGAWTQSITFARQVLSQFSHSASPGIQF
jgi:hypothetical protein